MVYKNGIKEYTIIGCSGALLYGGLMGLFWRDLIRGIIVGIIFGVLYSLCMALFSKHIEKKAKNLRMGISKVRTIICEGPANHKKGINAVGGWMFFSEAGIEFYPHQLNFGGHNLLIPIHDIVNVETKSKQLIIYAKAGKLIFIVNKANLWKQSIMNVKYSQ